MWGGTGVGAECAVCGRTVHADEVELELEFGALLPDGPTVHVHMPCFQAWERELMLLLSRPAEHGRLLDAERDTSEGPDSG